MPRQFEQAVDRRMQGGVVTLAHVTQLVDEVDEEEQRQECERDKRDRGHDVRVEKAANGFHAGAAACAAGCQPRRTLPWSRHHSNASAITKAPPCAPTSAVPMPTLPAATQACVRLMRL